MIVTGKVSLLATAIDMRWRLLTIGLVAVVVSVAYEWLNKTEISIQITPITALGVAIGLFLGFRCTVVWNRYWEARTLWGRLINASRTLARQLATLLQSDDPTVSADFYREMLRWHQAYVHAFRAHLRDDDPLKEASPYFPEAMTREMKTAVNLPAAILHRMGERLHDAWGKGMLTEFRLLPLDETMTEITEIQGGCERIKNTPIPPAFTYVSHRMMQAYCCLIPFGLVSDLRWFTPAVTLLISFAFLTLDQISDLIEQPFSTADNDLPLDAMTRTIDIDLLQRMGSEKVPPPMEPVDGVLL
ncbi:MAG: bestrophin family ion channel [Capsulimonadales bacterium]|nr:bestrophin family ion channel [Capsulimonadales bacterium]